MRSALIVCCPLLWLLCGCQPGPTSSPTPVAQTAAATASPSGQPIAELNDLYKQGKHLFDQTYQRIPQVKAKLHCSSCHLQGGTAPGAAPLVGIAKDYPLYSARAGREIDLAERVNECLERSMNGQAVPVDSQEMKAFLAYIDGLKADPVPPRGIPPLPPPPEKPDSARGKALYAAHCLACHKADGSGTYNGDTYVFPALWGEFSFNIGAGMAQPHKLAGFIFIKMPLGRGKTLTAQESWDIATYVAEQKRPDCPGPSLDYPKGGAPSDLPYKPSGK